MCLLIPANIGSLKGFNKVKIWIYYKAEILGTLFRPPRLCYLELKTEKGYDRKILGNFQWIGNG